MRKFRRMARLAAGCAATGLMMSQAAASPLMRPNNVTIYGDRGGEIIHYALKVARIREDGRSVRFKGRCDSACTLYLSLPAKNTCVSPGASFGFHLPYGTSPRNNAVAARYLVRSYPAWVNSWINAHGGLSHQLKVMPYSYASRYLPDCRTA